MGFDIVVNIKLIFEDDNLSIKNYVLCLEALLYYATGWLTLTVSHGGRWFTIMGSLSQIVRSMGFVSRTVDVPRR